MFKLLFDYIRALSDYNYRKAYWVAVQESKFNAINIALMALENKPTQNRPKKPRARQIVDRFNVPVFIESRA